MNNRKEKDKIIYKNKYELIKQWRFELLTPLPKKGAQPLGHQLDSLSYGIFEE